MPREAGPLRGAAALVFGLLLAAAPLRAQGNEIAEIMKKAPPPDAAQTEKLKEFKGHSGDPDMHTRAEQQERLALVDHPEAAKLLIEVGLRDDAYHVRDRAIWSLSKHKSDGSIALMRAELKSGSDEVKSGCALALSKMEVKPAGAAAEVAALLQGQGKPNLKRELCNALGFFGDKVATPALVVALSGAEEVSLAAASALGLIRDPTAAPALIKLLKGGTWQTQVAAIEALALLRVKEAVPPLIEYLASAQGRPRDDARQALIKITTRTFGMKADDWKDWWKSVESGWTVPPEPTKKETEGKEVSDAYGRKATEYLHITTHSKRLLFVLDISASMWDRIKVKRGYETTDSKFQSAAKIDLARHELRAVLKTLDKDTWFNVMCFETDIRPWKKDSVQATPDTVAEATQWFEHQAPRTGGGTIKQSSGVDENGWIMGRTNTYGALKWVYGRPIRPKSGGVTGNPKPVGNCDTVFFVTDGEPTEGETTNIPEILADAALWNKTAKLTIHTIGMSETSGLRDLLTGLAQQTGGKCVFVGE